MDERDDIAQLARRMHAVADGLPLGVPPTVRTWCAEASTALLRLQRERDDANAVAQEMIEEANAIQRKLAEAYERAAKVCDGIENKSIGWIRKHPDDLGDAYKHADGVSDGAAACANAIRSLTSGREG